MSDTVAGAPPRRPLSNQTGPAVCPECSSSEVRPSRKTHDSGKNGSYWRCQNCGVRFFGPSRLDARDSSSPGRGSRRRKDTLGTSIQWRRILHRWVFPSLVLVATIMAVVYMLERRTPPTGEGVVLPD